MPETIAVNAQEFRKTMGLFATGVTVLTAYDQEGGWLGMTANAVTSVSLDPLLLLVCVGKEATITPALLNGTGFALSFLNTAQEGLSAYFAGMWEEEQPPTCDFSDWTGGPRIQGCIGAVGCRTAQTLDGGDHWILIGEVEALYRSEGPAEPLVFFQGGYWTVGR